MDMVDTEYSAENATDIVKLKHKSPPTHASSAPPNDESTEGRPATKYGIESTSPPPDLNQSTPALQSVHDDYCDKRDLASTGVVKDLEEPDKDNIDATGRATDSDTCISINCSSSPTQCPADAQDTQSTPIARGPRLPLPSPATSTSIYCDICCAYYPATSCCGDRNSPRDRTPLIFPTPPPSTCASTVIQSPTPEYHISRGSSEYNTATPGTPRSAYSEDRYTSANPYIYVSSKIDATGEDRYRNNFSGRNTTFTSYAARARNDYGYTARADTPDARSTHSDRSESPYITRNNTVRRINDAESTTSCSPLISDARRASYVPQTDLKPIWSSAPYCEDDFEDWDDDDEGYDEDAKDDGDYIYNEADECGNGDDEY
ncbi:hypothetical protein AX16_010018 [Volvariella volvacea WC 439]|nr:hypothetical protein AX16_010018 [Volvariella volvacea WC 439]